MTKITEDEVRNLAELSAMSFSDGDIKNLTADMQNILGYIDHLSEVDVEGVEPTYQVGGLANVWREDVIEESDTGADKLLKLAPKQEKNQIKVTKVL